MKYILIEFTFGLKGQGYQVIEEGKEVRIVDLTGNDIKLPKVVEYKVVNGEELNSI